MGVGTGFFKANIAPLVAEQYRKTRQFIRVEKNGDRVIVDPVYTISRMYMVSVLEHVCIGAKLMPDQYFYFFINVGALVGQITMVYAEKVRFVSLLPSSLSGLIAFDFG
jgi:proton-dependent oligopeptide transporter, POT family